MIRILRDRHRTRSSSKEIKVIDVVSRSGHDGVISVSHQNCVAVVHFQYGITRMVGTIKILERKSARIVHSVIVDLVEIHFDWWIVDLVLVWGIAGPIAARRVNLHDN
jgi:hypothetical protein